VDPFVSASWLAEHIDDDVVVCDLRWSLDGSEGRNSYEQGHLPGAVFVDLDKDLASAPSEDEGRHPLPDAATWSATLGRLGISPKDTVVAYDNGVGAIAARLVWMLRVSGIDAALLDGGLAAWDGELEEGPVLRRPTVVPLRPWPSEVLATIDDVVAAPVVLDARDAARYRGEERGPDRRAGHIPGSFHVPFTGNVDEDGRLRSDDELRAIYEPLLADVSDDAPLISSCGSGVTACHDLLVLEHLGHDGGRLFPGSWSQWSADLSRRIALGDEPGGDA
jgi:thiosulfate/3-mercaptopyruvate sulfurtransferase